MTKQIICRGNFPRFSHLVLFSSLEYISYVMEWLHHWHPTKSQEIILELQKETRSPIFSSPNSGVTPIGRSPSVRNHVETSFPGDYRHASSVADFPRMYLLPCYPMDWFRFSAPFGQGSVPIIPLPFPQRSVIIQKIPDWKILSAQPVWLTWLRLDPQ